MPSVLVDTGVWYSFFDDRDRYNDRQTVDALAEIVQGMTVVIPWPVVYETLRTRMSRNRLGLLAFELQLKSPNVVFIDDSPYRDDALAECFESSIRVGRPLSMTDCLLRALMLDERIKLEYLATFNDDDFVDVCARRSIHLLPG